MVDLKALAAAVTTGNPDARVVYVTNPAQAIRVNITSPTKPDNVITSGYKAAGSVGAVDANAIAMLVSQPEFALSRNAALHMENATPLPIGTPGSPATMAAPDPQHVPRGRGCAALRVARQLGETPHRLHRARNKRHLVMRCQPLKRFCTMPGSRWQSRRCANGSKVNASTIHDCKPR